MPTLNLAALGNGNGTFTLLLTKPAGGAFDTGTVAQFTLAHAGGLTLPSGYDLLIGFDQNPQATPEPSTPVLVGRGGIAVLGRRRRRRTIDRVVRRGQ